jgi:pyrroloquinoline quinone biosynthesis protein D
MSTHVNHASYPALAGFARLKHDSIRDRWVLQGPERVLVLDETSKEIVDQCTGAVTVGVIIDALVAEYNAPRDMIEHDVEAVFKLLADKLFLVMHDVPCDK